MLGGDRRRRRRGGGDIASSASSTSSSSGRMQFTPLDQQQQQQPVNGDGDDNDDRNDRRRGRMEPLEIESNDGLTSSTDDDDVRLMNNGDESSWQDEEQETAEGGVLLNVIEDPHAQGMGGDLVSAVFGIIKAMVGPAILYLPHGFAQAGYMFAVPILLLSTALYLSSSTCLLDCWKLERSRRSSTASSSATSAHSSLSYPELALGAFGTRGETLVKIGIAAMQSGVCLTYLIFVPQNLQASVRILTGNDVPMLYFLWLMVVVEIPLSWIQNVRHFTITNVLANFLILYGLLTCLGFAANNLIESSTTEEQLEDGTDNNTEEEQNDIVDIDAEIIAVGPFQNIIQKMSELRPFGPGWFLFIGTSVLLFEGSITLLVPLQEAVDREEDKKKFPSLYWKVILGIICFYSLFGVFSWLSFGDEVTTAMTTSLPKTTLATTVQLAYSVAVVFTFPLQNFPSLEITTRTIQTSLRHIPLLPRTCSMILQNRNLISSVVVCLLALVASVTLDRLDKVVSLMGSLLGCPLAFVFPPLIHNRLDPDLSARRRIQNVMVAALGLLAMVFASLTTIIAW
mmetsp:Transcript_11609/g.27810  ORF Transcript_11609/g.27810 Transcript_11609/m.27810 type:complete len:569 (+) Transcript_11609:161-1867(+)